MEMQIRGISETGLSALKEIIRSTWHYDEFSSPETASRLAEVFSAQLPDKITPFSQVAVLDGTAAGIILVKNNKDHRCALSARFQQILSIVKLYASKEGRAVSQIFQNVNEIDEQLLRGCKKTYPAELALFAVRSSCQGKGIGKKLFHSALAYLKQQGLDEFYLFTDTSCNYGFYEHQGMCRRGQREHLFQINGQTVSMNFFLYDRATVFHDAVGCNFLKLY